MGQLASSERRLAVHGDTTSPGTAVLLHGFTQDHRSWDHVRAALDGLPTAAADAPGHGASGALALSVPETAAALRDAVAAPATYVGYSMGGRIALATAVEQPDAVERLVLVSATAGIDDPVERIDRAEHDAQLADRIERIGVAAFIDEWLRLPLFAGLSAEAQQRAHRLENSAAGLATSLRLAGTGVQPSYWGRLHTVAVPTLVIAGADDHKFVAIAERLATTLPRATLAIVPNAGHTVHLEQPSAFIGLLREWFAATPSVD